MGHERTAPKLLNQSIDFVLRPFYDDFHVSVSQVAYKSAQSKLRGCILRKKAVPHALHQTGNDEMTLDIRIHNRFYTAFATFYPFSANKIVYGESVPKSSKFYGETGFKPVA